MRILITGRSGYVSRALKRSLPLEHTVTCVGREDLDLTDTSQVDKWFDDRQFDVVLHTAINGGSRLVEESDRVLSDNLKMFFNLLKNKDKFSKLISFGSIAENNLHGSLYGLSKNIISRYIKDEPNFYNLRVGGVFDSNENKTRFIRSNIDRYIARTSQIIHQDKYMDFIYMNDLLTVVDHYIQNNDLPKTIDCVYPAKLQLSDLSNIINRLDTYKVDIQIENPNKSISYVGNGTPLTLLKLELIGIEKGIEDTFKIIKQNNNI